MNAAPERNDDLAELRALLVAAVEHLAESLLGAANKSLSTKRQSRWGAKGSLSVELRGRKRGEWFSHETGAGGGPFDLIMHARGCHFAEAVLWARTWTNTGTAPRPLPRLVDAERLAARETADAEEAADRAGAIRTARAMAQAAEPISGTLGAVYLASTRGIPCPAGGWPDAIRFHAGTRSLLAVATLADGAVQAVQRVHLTPSARQIEDTPEKRVKVTNGRLEGAVVRLPARVDAPPALAGTLLLAEGPETGLSVWTATGCETWVVFGVWRFQRVELPAGRRVILCRDDDRDHAPADKAVRKAVTTWRKAGADVSIATPWPCRRADKSDFNDVMQAGGNAAVLAQILPHAPTPSNPRIHRVPVSVSRDQVADAVRSFFQAAASFDSNLADAEGTLPPVHCVKVGVAIGKSHAARRDAVNLLAELRAKGDHRTIALAVPTHRLGAEQAEILEALPAFQAAGLRVATWRGRMALDPDMPGYADPTIPDADKARMCRNPEPVLEAQHHGLDAQDTACRRTIKDDDGKQVVHECVLCPGCKYQDQRRRKADLWIVPHELLFSSKPRTMGDLAAVIVDESAWQDGLEGTEGRGDRLPLDALRGFDVRPGESRDPSWLTLQDFRRRALAAIEPLSDGPLVREAMVGEISATEAAEARTLAFGRQVRPAVLPGMARAERLELLKQAAGNRDFRREARFWRAVQHLLADGGPAASGSVYIETGETQDGPQRMVRLQGRRDVAQDWRVPTLILDANLDIDLIRPFWPQAELVADVQAEAPHMHIRQVIDLAYAKSRMEPLDPEKAAAYPVEARRRLKNLREVRAIISREARKHAPGQVLVVAQKAIKEALAGLGRLPRNITLAHHNAVAGRDEWGRCAGVIVVGRTAPKPAAVERMAAAISGAAIDAVSEWYPNVPALRELLDGTTMVAEADQHPDSLAEAIRWQVCEGELIQIIGRGRGVNRTAANPLDVLVLADPPLPLPITPISAADLAPSTVDRMLAECGFAFENATHAAMACPALWANRETAKKALEGERLGNFPYRESLIGEIPQPPTTLRRADFQRVGAGQVPAACWYDPLLVDDPKSELSRLLGPLAWCRLEGEPAPDRLAPAPRKPAHSCPRPEPLATGHEVPGPPAQPPALPPAPGLHAVEPLAPETPAPALTPLQRPLLLLFTGRPVERTSRSTVPRLPGIPPPIGPPA